MLYPEDSGRKELMIAHWVGDAITWIFQREEFSKGIKKVEYEIVVGSDEIPQGAYAAVARPYSQSIGATKPIILLPPYCSFLTLAHEALHVLYPEIDNEWEIEYRAAMLWKQFVWEREGRHVSIEEYEEDKKLSVEELV